MMLQTEHGLEVGLFVDEEPKQVEKPVEAPSTEATAPKTRKTSAKK